MNAFVRKEIRLITPAAVIALVLAALPVWLIWPGVADWRFTQAPGLGVYAPFGLGVLLLGLASFGQELSLGTFSMLLAQPVSRKRVWRLKTTILAVAAAVVFGAFALSMSARVGQVSQGIRNTVEDEAKSTRELPDQVARQAETYRQEPVSPSRQLTLDTTTAVAACGLSLLAAVAGGLWTTLLFRNTTVAFWFSLMTPIVLGVALDFVVGFLPEENSFGPNWLPRTVGMGLAVALWCGYSVASFAWARRYFPRAQDLAWTGGVVSLPSLTGTKTGASIRSYQPLRAMVRKELQLQQINLLIGGFLLLGHLVVLAVRRFFLHYMVMHPQTAMLWESWPAIWLILPLLVGSTAVAEERKLGTLESYLCAPGGRRRGFVVKFGVAVVLGVFLGAVMPWALEWLGTLAGLPDHNSLPAPIFMDGQLHSMVGWWFVFAACLVLGALHASSLARSFLQAVGQALLLACFWVAVVVLLQLLGRTPLGVPFRFLIDKTYPGISHWQGPLIGWIGWPVFVGTVLALLFRNYRKLQIDGRSLRRNGFALAAAVMFTATSTTLAYHRVWELFMAEEPAAQAPLAGFQGNVQVELKASPQRMAAVLPDGKLWLRQRRPTQEKDFAGRPEPSFTWVEGFAGGSDWREVALSDGAGCFAIRQDGSLWDMSYVDLDGRNGPAGEMLGDDRDWKTISVAGGRVTALKTNGTLWQWENKKTTPAKKGATDRIHVPTQVGSDADWVAITDTSEMTVAVKKDGSVWRFGRIPYLDSKRNQWTRRYVDKPERWLSFPGPRPASLSLDPGDDVLAAVGEDGSLWLGGEIKYGIYSGILPESSRREVHETPPDATGKMSVLFLSESGRSERGEMARLDMGVGWKEFCFRQAESYAYHEEGLIAVKENGELWEWTGVGIHEPSFPPGATRIQLQAGKKSHYSDWASVSPYDQRAFAALGRDGRLCEWRIPEGVYLWNGYRSDNWLAPTRVSGRKVAQITP